MAQKEKQFGRIRGARTASKKQERELVERARRLKADPTLVVPDLESCGGGCFLCPFARALSRMRHIQEFADDKDKLERMASSGDDLSRAYAATLLLAIAGKAPFFGRVLTPFGEALYAVRGKCLKEKLILVQHFDNPGLRLLGLLDYVKNKGYHIYSADGKYYCSGKKANPPKEFVDYMFKYLNEKVDIVKDGNAYVCRHLTAKDLKDPSVGFLNIHWVSADMDIALCERCVRHSGNTFHRFLMRMGAPKPRLDIEPSVVGALRCLSKCESCDIDTDQIDPELIELWYTGKIGDKELLSKQLDSIHEALRTRGDLEYVIGNKCYGTDKAAFLKALKPSTDEELAVNYLLKKMEGAVIVHGETAAKFIEENWKEFGKGILRKILGDKEEAAKLFDSLDMDRDTPTQVIRDALVRVRTRDIISQLPVYDKLPPIARYADQVARVYMASGADEAARYIERNIPDDARVRPVALALLKAMGKDTSKTWAFEESERDFSDFLKDKANEFLSSTPETYHTALQALLSGTGSTETISTNKSKPE